MHFTMQLFLRSVQGSKNSGGGMSVISINDRAIGEKVMAPQMPFGPGKYLTLSVTETSHSYIFV